MSHRQDENFFLAAKFDFSQPLAESDQYVLANSFGVPSLDAQLSTGPAIPPWSFEENILRVEFVIHCLNCGFMVAGKII